MKKIIALLTCLFFSINTFGATRIYKEVAPSGGDYTTLEACLNANEQDLVSNDSYLDVEITGSWSSADTTSVTLHNYTLDSNAAGDNYIKIYTDEDNRAGTSWDGARYKLVPPVGYGCAGLYIPNAGKIIVDGLQIAIQNNPSYTNSAIQVQEYSGNGLLIENCHFAAFDNEAIGEGVDIGENPNYFNITVRNTIIDSFGNGIYHNKYDGVLSTTTIENVTVRNCINSGINNREDVAVFVCKNVLSYGNGADGDFKGTIHNSSTNNLSSDDTAPAYNTYYRNKTISFVSATDHALTSTDTDAIDKGVDLSSIFTTDIMGTTRSGTWDIGAFEYVAAASPATTSGFIPYYKWFSR